MGKAFLMGQGGSGGISDLIGELSFTGTYATSGSMGCNANGEVFLAILGFDSTLRENVIFNLVSAPSGITLSPTTTTYTHASNNTGNYFGCRLEGVDKKINIAVDMTDQNTTYDWVRADLTVTYA